MNGFPSLFEDIKNEPQFSNPLDYKKWVINKYLDIFNTERLESISDLMLIHQILYPQIKRMAFENQLKIVLKMCFTVVRANSVQVRSILTGAKKDALGFRKLLN
tara:strand:- start:126 stop:437 length:312 start_codon:yes stop_codon:yes gene_type:complete